MTWSSVGSIVSGNGALNPFTITVNPTAVGDILVAVVASSQGTSTLSGGGVTTWNSVSYAPGGPFFNTSFVQILFGEITSTGSQSLTFSVADHVSASVQQFHSSYAGPYGFDPVTPPTNFIGGVTSGTFPSVTPTSAADELYVGNSMSGAAYTGTTAGFIYNAIPNASVWEWVWSDAASGVAQTPAFTLSASSNYAGIAVCIGPASSAQIVMVI